MGVQELVVVLIIALVVFGPGKLPELGRSLGKSIAEFKAAVSKMDESEKNKKKTYATLKLLSLLGEFLNTA